MIANHVARRVSEIVQKRIDALGIGQRMQDLPEELWHKSFKYYVKEDKTRKGGPNMRLIRLDPEKPSLTVTGHIFNKFVHPYENRYITVREAARLQGFPDDVEFKGTLTSTQKQVGNAVPVQLAKAVFEQICNASEDEKITAFSLFCGAGGLDIGAHQARDNGRKIKTLLAIDCWKDACDTLAAFAIKTKVNTENIENIEDPLEYWKRETGCDKAPQLIYGGPPCQSFSQAGKQKGVDDPRGQLIYEYLRFIEAIHPKYFVMENVSNIKSVGGGALYHEIIGKMEAMGYAVDVGVLCAADYGAPQKRRRAIFIGTDSSLKKVTLPSPTHAEDNGFLPLKKYSTVRDAFEGLPYLGKCEQ